MEDKSEKKYSIYNWNPEKEESPYDYGSEYPKYQYLPFKYRILNKKETDKIFDSNLTKEKYLGEISFFMDIWDLHLIDNIRITNLINPVSFTDKEGNEFFNFLKIINEIEYLIEEDKPVKVYLSYPFSKKIEQIIEPINLTTFWSEIVTTKSMEFGYIAWQIGILYGELYKNHSEEIGVYGHSMSDLQLGGLKVYKDNFISLTVNS